MKGLIINLESAYQNCIQFASHHYENFPVISLFIQKQLRKHVAVIYCFARYADDIADEGDENKEEKLNNINQFKIDFQKALNGEYKNDFWIALHNTIIKFKVDPGLLFALLNAFHSDIIKNRFVNFNEITSYCNNSANPIGRIILRLHGYDDEQMDLLSDKICTGLQLTNFYQDLGIDLKKNRIYLPLEELKEFNVTEDDLLGNNFNSNVKELIKFQVERNREYYKQGKLLLNYLSQRLKIQIGLTINGGEKILSKIEQFDYNVLNFRPTLRKYDFLSLFFKTIL